MLLPSPKATLGRIAELVRPGGVVGIQVPKVDSLGFRLLKGRWRHAIYFHYYFFTESTMARYLHEAGFDLVDSRTAPKYFSAALLLDRLWEWAWAPRSVAELLGGLARRLGLADLTLRVDPKDDLLAHGRRL